MSDLEKYISDKLGDHYRSTFNEHGASPRGVDWGDTATTELRYQRMANILNLGPQDKPILQPIILDVGCGYGGLLDHFSVKGKDINYIGIDVCEDLINKVRELHPWVKFVQGSVLTRRMNKPMIMPYATVS